MRRRSSGPPSPATSSGSRSGSVSTIFSWKGGLLHAGQNFGRARFVVPARRRLRACPRGAVRGDAGAHFRRRHQLRGRRPVSAARRHRVLRGRSARPAQRGDRQPRQGPAQRARQRRVQRAVLHPQADRHVARERADLLRDQQPREQAGPGVLQLRARRAGHQRPDHGRRCGRRIPHAPGLHRRRRRMAGRRGARQQPALPELPGRGAAERQSHRRAGPDRVQRPDHSPGRDVHVDAGGRPELPRLRDLRHEHGALEPHGA